MPYVRSPGEIDDPERCYPNGYPQIWRRHSFYAWVESNVPGWRYYRDCSILGCDIREYAKELVTAGETKLVQEPSARLAK